MAEIAMVQMEAPTSGFTHEEGQPTPTNHPPSTNQPPQISNPPQPSTQQLPPAGHGNLTSSVAQTESDNCEGIPRERWTSTGEFIASVLSLSIHFGTFTTLPYFSATDGAAFMVIYAGFYFILGVPIMYLDLCLGQFCSRGPAHIWNLCPLFRGIGVGMMVSSAMYYPVYNLFSSWSLYYVVQSFYPVLPWSNCNNAWNTPACSNNTYKHIGPSTEYFYKRVLQVSESSGFEDMGGLQWELVGCCAGVSVLVFAALFWGMKVLGKVFCITMLLMCAMTLVLFIGTMTLPGSQNGLAFLFAPNFGADLKKKNVWSRAFFWAMFTVGMSSGLVSNLASYRHFKSSALRDSLIICSISAAGRLLAGLMIMSLYGVLVNTQQKRMNYMVKTGIMSAFQPLPELFPHLSVSQFWSLAYFAIFLLVGFNLQLIYAEMIITAIVDSLPRRSRMIRLVVTAVVCITSLLLTLPYLAKGGARLMILVDVYIIEVSFSILGILQFLTIGWIYGMGRLSRDIEMMTGIPPPIVFKFIWCFILPPVILIFLVLSFIDYDPQSFYSAFPVWAHVMGWFIALASLVPLPVFAVIALFTSSQHLLRPKPEWGPAEVEYKRQYDNQRQYNVTLRERITSVFTN
ncbi:sodium-dependent noradrenaline transporter-like [Haliotis rufescens]|uniref:sodium-dependent noradrenaline transporter-like n=1 Tax=Haliotis rufescens TaxID=6454 RepID=UPI00201EEF3C|nr:sodium-dependent noradrenaline transporter-like [Haliotis rufescens]